MDLIKQLRESDRVLLQSEAEDLQKWSKLRHNKSDFELFLSFNLAEVEFKDSDGNTQTIVCTSNTPLIKTYSAVKEPDKKKAAKLKTVGIHSPKMDRVLTWDLRENKMKTILLKSWQILNFVSITKDNVLLLDTLIHRLLTT